MTTRNLSSRKSPGFSPMKIRLTDISVASPTSPVSFKRAAVVGVLSNVSLTDTIFGDYRLIKVLVDEAGGSLVVSLDGQDPMQGEFCIINSASGVTGDFNYTTTIQAPPGGTINGMTSFELTEEDEAVVLQYLGDLQYHIVARTHGPYLSTVATDVTLTGDGTVGSPLSVVNMTSGASQPSADPGMTPHVYVQTTTPPALWFWDGVSWTQITTLGAAPPLEY